jgi:hypothetical protein
VPSVTTSDGSCSPVTSRPLKPPQAAPTTSATTIASQSGTPAATSAPSTALASPRIEATDRSIWPAMMIIVSGTAMIAFSIRSAVTRERVVLDMKVGESAAPSTAVPASSSTSSASHRPSNAPSRFMAGSCGAGCAARAG